MSFANRLSSGDAPFPASAARSLRRRAAAASPRTSPRRLVHALTACSLLTFWPGAADLRAQVLPSGMNPVAGQVTARTVGGTLTVNNSPNSIINWNSFSIGAGNAVRFEQAAATSQVLNRVTGNDPSAILGSLSSNGRVWLLNPNGVLFGQSARVNVAGLVTSTLNLNNADWLAGNFRFTQGPGAPAAIVNQGELRSSLGGEIALIGATVRNEGEINAPGGRVLLAAGKSVELIDSATPNVGVKVNSGAGEVVNLGSLLAAGGRIDACGHRQPERDRARRLARRDQAARSCCRRRSG
jgi:filamentous hemagglutinin family protein